MVFIFLITIINIASADEIVWAKINTIKYGKSGLDKPLYAFELNRDDNNYEKTLLITFELHGFEDSYDGDGRVLVNIGYDVLVHFLLNPDKLNDYRLIIIPSANPDGLEDGWTNNGPGRTTVVGKVDLNRDFGKGHIKRKNTRNYTLKPFSVPESRALRDLVIDKKPDMVIDVHGWLSTTYGDKSLTKPFQKYLKIGYSGNDHGAGYFVNWAGLYAESTALIELPNPKTKSAGVISALEEIMSK